MLHKNINPVILLSHLIDFSPFFSAVRRKEKKDKKSRG
jgi:hypothetical protein